MSISIDNVALPQELKQRLAQLAEQTGKPWEDVLAEAIAAYRPRVKAHGGEEESFFDAATRFGLIGCVEGGPRDLSTNPRYMEGFGRHGA